MQRRAAAFPRDRRAEQSSSSQRAQMLHAQSIPRRFPDPAAEVDRNETSSHCAVLTLRSRSRSHSALPFTRDRALCRGESIASPVSAHTPRIRSSPSSPHSSRRDGRQFLVQLALVRISEHSQPSTAAESFCVISCLRRRCCCCGCLLLSVRVGSSIGAAWSARIRAIWSCSPRDQTSGCSEDSSWTVSAEERQRESEQWERHPSH